MTYEAHSHGLSTSIQIPSTIPIPQVKISRSPSQNATSHNGDPIHQPKHALPITFRTTFEQKIETQASQLTFASLDTMDLIRMSNFLNINDSTNLFDTALMFAAGYGLRCALCHWQIPFQNPLLYHIFDFYTTNNLAATLSTSKDLHNDRYIRHNHNPPFPTQPKKYTKFCITSQAPALPPSSSPPKNMHQTKDYACTLKTASNQPSHVILNHTNSLYMQNYYVSA